VEARARSLISVNAIAFVIGAALLFLIFGAGSGDLAFPAAMSAVLFCVLFRDVLAWRRSGIRRIEPREDGINAWRGLSGDFSSLSFWEASGLYKVSSGARTFAHILTGGRANHLLGVHWVSGSRWSLSSDSFDDVEFAVFVGLLERSIESWRAPRLATLLMAGDIESAVLDEDEREEAGALLSRILVSPYDETRDDERRRLEEYAESLSESSAPVLSIEEIESAASRAADSAPSDGGTASGAGAAKPFWPGSLTIDPELKIKALLALHRLYPGDPGRIPAGLCSDEDEEVAAMARGYRV
jgi:hypothetical protein